MSSGGGSSGNQTTTQELPGWAQPYAQQLLERGSDLSNSSAPVYSGQQVASLNAQQQNAIGGLGNAASYQEGTTGTAQNLANSLAGGSYYQTSNPYTGNVTASTAANAYADPANNPYLSSVVNQANQDLTTAYNNTTGASALAQFRNAGAFGGSAQQDQTTANQKQLADQISQQTAGMYNSAYNTAANVATQNAAQQNAVGLANQSVGTSAAQSANAQNSNNYYNYLNAQQNAVNGATSANSALSSLYGNQYTGGAAAQSNSQDKLNAAYQAWLQQVNQPYTNLSTLSSALSGALGSGTGITSTTGTAGSGNSLATLLGLGSVGLGAYNAFQ
jgi:hypothetical protein